MQSNFLPILYDERQHEFRFFYINSLSDWLKLNLILRMTERPKPKFLMVFYGKIYLHIMHVSIFYCGHFNLENVFYFSCCYYEIKTWIHPLEVCYKLNSSTNTFITKYIPHYLPMVLFIYLEVLKIFSQPQNFLVWRMIC